MNTSALSLLRSKHHDGRHGSDIFTADMSSKDKQAAALNAAVEYLKAAGYTFDEATGKFTAAPRGREARYELMIPADGTGDHRPS